MGLLSLNTDVAGQIGVNPRRVKMVTTDNLTAITTAGYLNPQNLEGRAIYPTDIFDVIYSYNQATNSGTYGEFLPTFSSGVITLNQDVSEGNVTFPVVDGDFAVFDGTAGKIKDAGYLPSDAAKTAVVMASAAVIANHIACFSDTAGTVNDDAATAINGGNIQAGLSGTAGTLASFPATASKGSLVVAAVANTNDTVTTLSNVAMGQASVVSIPDPANALGRLLVGATATPFTSGNFPVASGTGGLMVDSGLAAANIQNKTNIKAATTADIGGAGAGPISVVVAGLTAASVVVATVESSSNPVSVVACTATATGFDITFSADPGAACLVNYVAFIAAQ